MTTQEKINNVVSYLPAVGLLALMATLPFHYGSAQRIALYWLALAYPIDYIVNRRWQGWHWSHRNWVYVAFIAFFCLIPIWQIFDPQLTPLFQFTIERYVPFLAIGICGLLGVTDKFRVDYVAWTMLATSVSMILYLVAIVGLQPDFTHWCFLFNLARIEHINTHMVFNLYLNLSLILGAFVVIYGKRPLLARILTAIAMLAPIFALLITEGRTGLLTLLLCTFVLLLYYMLCQHRWWMLSLVALFVIVAGVIVMNNERLEVARTTTNPRIYIWKVAGQMIMDRPILGYGVCSAREEFIRRGLADDDFNAHYADEVRTMPCYSAQGRIHFEIMHPHNAILETWTQFGVLGVFLLVVCLMLPLLMRLQKYQLYLDLCVLAFAVQACFESLGNNLQPMYLCLMVVLFHTQFISDVRSRTILSHQSAKLSPSVGAPTAVAHPQ